MVDETVDKFSLIERKHHNLLALLELLSSQLHTSLRDIKRLIGNLYFIKLAVMEVVYQLYHIRWVIYHGGKDMDCLSP